MLENKIPIILLSICIGLMLFLITPSLYPHEIITTPLHTNQVTILSNEAIIKGNNLIEVNGIGNSMLPVLGNPSKAVLEQNFSYDSIQPGDIVFYKNSTEYSILHRVYWRNNTHFQCKGDNNNIPDPYILPLKNIKGIVIAIIY